MPEPGEWQWDLASIQALTATDNVADFMIRTLQRLGPHVLADSCSRRRVSVPSSICKRWPQLGKESPGACAAALAQAVHVGLLVPIERVYHPLELPAASRRQHRAADLCRAGSESYKFVHERVQQAAYAMLAESARQELHLQLGRLRLAAVGNDAATGKLFDLVNHLNLGSPRLVASGDEQGLLELARLNLVAGQRAKSTAAFHAAAGFFTTATTLLSESAWDTQHALVFELHLERAHCEDPGRPLHRSRGAPARCSARAPARRSSRAWCSCGCVSCTLPAVSLPRPPRRESKGWRSSAWRCRLPSRMPRPPSRPSAWLMSRAALDGRRLMELVALPLNQSAAIDTALSLIIAMAIPVYMSGSPLYPLLMARQLTLALRHGLSRTDKLRLRELWLLAGHRLSASPPRRTSSDSSRSGAQPAAAQPWHGVPHRSCAGCIHALLPAAEDCASAHLEKAEKEGLISGDFAYLSVACSSRAQLFPYTSEDLSSALRETEDYLVLMQRTKDALGIMQLTHTRQLLRALVGRTGEPTSLSDADFDEAAVWQGLRQSDVAFALNNLAWIKLTLLYLFGKYAEACALGLESEVWFASAPESPSIPSAYFCSAWRSSPTIPACRRKSGAATTSASIVTISSYAFGLATAPPTMSTVSA